MFTQADPNGNNAQNTMRDFARTLFASEREAKVQSESEPPAEVSPSFGRSAPIRPGIRRVSIPGLQPAAPAAPAPSSVLTPPVAEASSELPAKAFRPADSASLTSVPLSEGQIADISETPAAPQSTGTDAAEPLSEPPKIRRVPGLKRIEIKKAMSNLQSGALRPPFHVPKTAQRFSSLNEAVMFSRQLLPLPREMQLAQKPAHRTWLIAQINHCENRKMLSDFAFSLNYKDLATLFPALATLTRGEEVDRLISIIMMRASKYLYLQGWITLQYAYPRSTVQKGLAELCTILERQPQAGQQDQNPEEDPWFDALHLGPERIDWKSVRLISEISMPNTRHFLAGMTKYIRENNMSGDEFFKRYGIYRDLPLGQAIRSQWEMAMFERRINNPLSAPFFEKQGSF